MEPLTGGVLSGEARLRRAVMHRGLPPQPVVVIPRRVVRRVPRARPARGAVVIGGGWCTGGGIPTSNLPRRRRTTAPLGCPAGVPTSGLARPGVSSGAGCPPRAGLRCRMRWSAGVHPRRHTSRNAPAGPVPPRSPPAPSWVGPTTRCRQHHHPYRVPQPMPAGTSGPARPVVDRCGRRLHPGHRSVPVVLWARRALGDPAPSCRAARPAQRSHGILLRGDVHRSRAHTTPRHPTANLFRV